MDTITISTEEYKALVKCETRIDVLADYLVKASYMNRNHMMMILGLEEDKDTNEH